MPKNIAPTNANLNDLKLFVYNLTFGDDSLGFVDEGTLNINIGGRYVKKGVDQIAAEVAKAWFLGHTVTVEVTLSAADIQFATQKLLEGTVNFRPGVNGDAWELGDYGLDVSAISKELSIVPASNASGDLSNSFFFNKAFVDLDATPLVWTGNKAEFQSLPVTFGILPDLNQNREARLGLLGDISALGDTAPTGIVITSGKIQSPYKAADIFTTSPSGQVQLSAYGIWSDDDSLGALLNDAAMDTTKTALAVDGFSGGSEFAIGDILLIGSELVYISGKSDANNYTMIRGILGTVPFAHADDAAITKQTNIRIVNISQQVVWSEVADASNVLTLGDSANATDSTRKGFCAADPANTGTATLKCTYTDTTPTATDSNTVSFVVA